MEQLDESWPNVYSVLYNHLNDDFDRWEYVRVTGVTRSSGTPHYHLLVYVDDPDDELSIDTARSAVDSYVRANDRAEKRHHEVEPDQSDAGIVTHTVPQAYDDIDDNDLAEVYYYRDEESFSLSSVFLTYMLSQYPSWVLEHIRSPEGRIDIHDPVVDGAAVLWASPYNAISTSQGFPD